jgi:hypothetical protein
MNDDYDHQDDDTSDDSAAPRSLITEPCSTECR